MMKNFWEDENGQGMVEYALIIALIAIVLVTALSTVGGKLTSKFNSIGSALDSAGSTTND